MSRYNQPALFAIVLEVDDFPEPLGPSIATTMVIASEPSNREIADDLARAKHHQVRMQG